MTRLHCVVLNTASPSISKRLPNMPALRSKRRSTWAEELVRGRGVAHGARCSSWGEV